jgi:hypothetical protein
VAWYSIFLIVCFSDIPCIKNELPRAPASVFCKCNVGQSDDLFLVVPHVQKCTFP